MNNDSWASTSFKTSDWVPGSGPGTIPGATPGARLWPGTRSWPRAVPAPPWAGPRPESNIQLEGVTLEIETEFYLDLDLDLPLLLPSSLSLILLPPNSAPSNLSSAYSMSPLLPNSATPSPLRFCKILFVILRYGNWLIAKPDGSLCRSPPLLVSWNPWGPDKIQVTNSLQLNEESHRLWH